MGIDGFDRNKTSLTGAIFLSQSQNAAYRTLQYLQSTIDTAAQENNRAAAASPLIHSAAVYILHNDHI